MLSTLNTKKLLVACSIVALGGAVAFQCLKRCLSRSQYASRMTRFGPVAAMNPHTVVFGAVKGENRGDNPMSPPITREDPLFWLRDDERKNPDVLAHLRLENEFFASKTAELKTLAEKIYSEHIGHIKETDSSAPYNDGPFAYYTRTVKDLAYTIHCRVPRGNPVGEGEEILLDENVLSRGHTHCVVKKVESSPDHKLVAYSVDFLGSELFTIRLLSVAGGGEPKLLEENITNTNGCIVWGRDSSEFYYATRDAVKRTNKVWKHQIGGPQSEDVCLKTEDDELFFLDMGKSLDNMLLITSSSSETSECYFLDLNQESAALQIVRPREKGVRYSVQPHRPTKTLYIMTNADKSINNKIVVASTSTPSKWTTVLEHSATRNLTSFIVLQSHIAVTGREGGLARVWTTSVASLQESHPAVMKEIQAPEPVFTMDVCFGQHREFDVSALRVVYSSLTTPNVWQDIDFKTHSVTVVKQREVPGYNPAECVCEQLFAEAPDKTRIPISIVRRKDLDMSVPHPTMLYGYGAYGISRDPEFGIAPLPYLQRGMVFAIAHIRGGEEMGRAWFEVGAKYLTKRNSFQDFISCAEHLIATGRTTADTLSCEGRSAGGLLIAAVLNMRPDLWACAIAGVPFVDVMTTMCDASIPLTTWEWEEWGNPNEHKYFDYMLSYSPVDNVRPQYYPNIFISAGLNDPRVPYWEPTKWASKLRWLKLDHNDVLLKMDMDTGHFSNSDRYRFWREKALEQAFVIKHVTKTLV